jgi:hypothetical protein
MIGSILLCDRCGETGGALAAPDGATSRKVAYRGTIRRVKVGRTHYRVSGPGRLHSLDLCGRCNTPKVLADAQRDAANRAERYGEKFTRA